MNNIKICKIGHDVFKEKDDVECNECGHYSECRKSLRIANKKLTNDIIELGKKKNDALDDFINRLNLRLNRLELEKIFERLVYIGNDCVNSMMYLWDLNLNVIDSVFVSYSHGRNIITSRVLYNLRWKPYSFDMIKEKLKLSESGDYYSDLMIKALKGYDTADRISKINNFNLNEIEKIYVAYTCGKFERCNMLGEHSARFLDEVFHD